MNQERQENINRQISEQAAEWLDGLSTAGTQERAAFAEWVAASPRHLEEFLFISALDSELGRVDPERRLDVATLMATAKSNVTPLDATCLVTVSPTLPRTAREGPPTLPRIDSGHKRMVGLLWSRWAASVAGIGVATLLTYFYVGNGGYTTAVGEQRTIELVDGSVLQLNSRSRIETQLTATGRDIKLLQGEATFKVFPDPTRPFRVHAGGAMIQAIGTQFNVNQRPSGVTVSVIEGRVKIFGDQPAVLNAGEEARVGRAGRIERRGNVDPLNISAWRQHRLVFRDDTLEDIVAEFNRYNANSQIRLEGDTILARRYTAVFDANDPASLIAFLREDENLIIDRNETQLIIHAR